jgi:hypothetical protein
MVCIPFPLFLLSQLFVFLPFSLLDDATPSFSLPLSWTYDLVDEFVYHFQSFHSYRAKIVGKPEEAQLLEHSNTWSLAEVSSCLRTMVSKSNIVRILAEGGEALLSKLLPRKSPPPVPSAAPAEVDLSQPVPLTGLPALRLTLGYFALTGLGRLSVLLGDYYVTPRTFSLFDLKEKKITSAPSLVV